MQESSFEGLVGLIVAMTDDIGKRLTYSALESQGMLKQVVAEFIKC